jgi:hypothetical protein
MYISSLLLGSLLIKYALLSGKEKEFGKMFAYKKCAIIRYYDIYQFRL